MLGYLVHHLISVATAVGTVLLALHLLSTSTRRSSQSVLAWLLALVFIPPITIPLYLLLGTRKIARRAPLLPRADERDVDPAPRPVARVVMSMGLAPPRCHNGFEVIGDGVRAYERLLTLVRGATRSIHVTVFILGDDKTVGKMTRIDMGDNLAEFLNTDAFIHDQGF